MGGTGVKEGRLGFMIDGSSGAVFSMMVGSVVTAVFAEEVEVWRSEETVPEVASDWV
jgi:hypothetical protein